MFLAAHACIGNVQLQSSRAAKTPFVLLLGCFNWAAAQAPPGSRPRLPQWRFAPACCAAQSARLRLSQATRPLRLLAPPCVCLAKRAGDAPTIQNSSVRVAVSGSAVALSLHRGGSECCRLTHRSTGGATARHPGREASSAYHPPRGQGASPPRPGYLYVSHIGEVHA